MTYEEFLKTKIKVEQPKGIKVDRKLFHHSGKPHQNDIIEWAIERGAALVAPDTGLGKSHICIEVMRIIQMKFGGKCLIATELGATETFINPDPSVGEGARLGVKLGRRAFLTELNDTYARCANVYLREEEYKQSIPTLFDAINEIAI